jgi:hypothetical protein
MSPVTRRRTGPAPFAFRRSLSGIGRKWNARTRGAAGRSVPAFVYRDTAEMERQKGGWEGGR